MKTKLLLAFWISIAMSVLLFMYSTYYLVNYGYFSGIKQADMQRAVKEIQNAIEVENNEELKRSFLKVAGNYEKMEFSLLCDGVEVIQTNDELSVPKNEEELLNEVQGNSEVNQKYEVAASVYTIMEQEYTIICYVDKTNYEAMTYEFNFQRGTGILGKIGLVGFFITFVITSSFLFLFTQKSRNRMEKIYSVMHKYDFDNAEIRICDGGKDEIGELADSFDRMAENLQNQFAIRNRYEQNRKSLVSSLAHDLRTPMSSIIGYSEMIRDGIFDDEQEQKKYVDIIHRKAIYMNQILTELLDFSRLDMGNYELNKTNFDAAELLREILIEYYAFFVENNYELVFDIQDEKYIGNWDKERLGRVVRNVIDNSIKYGMDGKKLYVKISKETKWTVIEIRDFGVGMTKENMEHAFEQFYRSDNARNSKKGGMGLGLVIASEIMKKHSGSIQMESNLGEGVDTKLFL
jgi:histidine kinase